MACKSVNAQLWLPDYQQADSASTVHSYAQNTSFELRLLTSRALLIFIWSSGISGLLSHKHDTTQPQTRVGDTAVQSADGN
jgi:hypothetical protein